MVELTGLESYSVPHVRGSEGQAGLLIANQPAQPQNRVFATNFATSS